MFQSRYHKLIHRQQRLLPCVIFHFDPVSRALRAFPWPVTPTGERVTPSDFLNYRAMHDFKAPCCLCATVRGGYTESAVYLAPQGPYVGEYVAGCASERCGYIVCIERMYTKIGLLIDKYPVRQAGNRPPPPVLYAPGHYDAPSNAQSRESSPAKRFDALWASIPAYEQQASNRQKSLIRLLKLDSSGLSKADFKQLFAMCRCGLVTTRRIFRDHICAVTAAPVIIDLTSDASDDEAEPSGPTVIDLTGDSDEDSQ